MNGLALQDGKVDVVLPLGKSSHAADYGEAKFLLRSIERNCKNLGRLIVASITPPIWLRNAIIVPIEDDLPHNKDGNMITKVVKAIDICRCDRFCVCADDNCFINTIDLGRIPVIHGGGSKAWFEAQENKNNWHRRCLATYDFFRSWGIDESISFDTTHAPQTFTKSKLWQNMQSIPYREGNGLGIYSCLHLASGETHGQDWNGWIVRAQNAEEAKRPWNKVPMLSYTDEAWDGGISARLAAMFPTKSRYEK